MKDQSICFKSYLFQQPNKIELNLVAYIRQDLNSFSLVLMCLTLKECILFYDNAPVLSCKKNM